MAERTTACFLCECNCGMVVTLGEDGRIAEIRGDEKNPLSKGFLCPKGRRQAAHIDSPHRLTKPLARREGKLVEVSWEEALDGVASGLRKVREAHGARSIGLAFGGSPHPMLQGVMGYMFLRALGSRNMYSPVSLEFTSKYLANQKMFGCSYFEGHPDYEHARFLLLVGTNPMVSHPAIAPEVKRASKDPERTLVVVDPRTTETARIADIHARIQPASDIHFFLALLQVILSEGLQDRAFSDRHCRGLDRVARAVARFTPEAVSPVTGLAAGTIREIARKLAGERPGFVFYDMGVVGGRHSTLVSWAVKSLMMVTGNVGVKGGILFNPPLLNWNRFEKISFAGKKYVSRVRGFPEVTGHLPVTVLQDEILTPGPGQIRAMVVAGCNPLRAYTHSVKMERAFRDLELLVSIDPFLTEVGRLAHYVLPVASFYEQDNISFGFHEMYPVRFVQLTRAIRPPLGESRPEWMIYRDLSRRLGVHFLNNTAVHWGLEAADWIRKRSGKPGGLNYQEALFRLIARAGKTTWAKLEAHPHGLVREGGKPSDMMAEIRTKDGKARLDVPEFLTAVEGLGLNPPPGDPDYPLLLATTCRTWTNLNTLYRDEARISKESGAGGIVLNPRDAEALGVRDGQNARLSTRAGEDRALVALSDDVPPGAVYLSHGWGLESRDPADVSGETRGTAAARFLSDEEGDAFTGMPLYNGVPCRVETLGAESRSEPAPTSRRTA